MSLEERTQELLKGLRDGVVTYDVEACMELSRAVLEEGVDAYKAITDGLAAGMEKAGELYATKKYFVPELLSCSDALYAGLDILRPHIRTEEATVKGQIVLGVIQGDIHNIGKNLVKAMLDAAGWIVQDLGRNVKFEDFVKEQARTNADIVGISALMTTSMLGMPKVITMIKEANPKVFVMVGGAPLTREIAKAYGADGYAKDASEAVSEAARLMNTRQESKE